MTSNDYFQLIDDNKDKLIRLIEKFHPATRTIDNGLVPESLNYPITAKLAEIACQKEREIIKEKGTINPITYFINAIDSKDIERIVNILNETWFGMPESSAIHNEPGFYVLCDLCSDFPDDIEFEE